MIYPRFILFKTNKYFVNSKDIGMSQNTASSGPLIVVKRASFERAVTYQNSPGNKIERQHHQI